MEHQYSSIRWIVFDAVGTLIFADPPVHLAYYRVGQKYGSRLTPAEVRTRFHSVFAGRSRESDAAGSSTAEAGEREFWRAVVADVLPDVVDHGQCFEELFAHFAEPASWQCYADVEETLSELSGRGYRLAIASNFDARLHGICDGLRELQDIERRIISSEVGARKPAIPFYEAVLSVCECRADDLLMIGDDQANDVAGPAKAGIGAWRLDRGDTTGACLSTLSALVDRLPVLRRNG